MGLGKIVHWLLDFLNPPTLVYRVEFIENGPKVVVNEIDYLGLISCATTEVIGQDAQPPLGVVQPLARDGLVLQITRPPSAEATRLVALMCGIAATGLRRFRLNAHYELLGLEPTGLWAATLFARSGGATMDEADIAVGATHQVVDDPVLKGRTSVRLGAGSGASLVKPPARNESIEVAQAYLLRPFRPPVGEFVLETDIDCFSGTGRSRLSTPGHTWTERVWPNPFKEPAEQPMTHVGVGLAVVRGIGTATVVVKTFSISTWSGPMTWWVRLLTNLR
jgi:hypothetical protein